MPQGTPIFYHKAPGKLMLSGEYSVLHGALSLAWPTHLGQRISVYKSSADSLHWKALDSHNEVWLEAIFFADERTELIHGTAEQAAFVLQILRQAQNMNPDFQFYGYQVVTELEFDRQWGLGSSSTFLVCLAKWAGVNAFDLFFKTMKGSGYDVAVGLENQSVAYRLIKGQAAYNCVQVAAPDKETLYFIYLGQKQISSKEVQAQEKRNVSPDLIEEIDHISQSLLVCKTAKDWDEMLEKHEEITSKITGKIPIKKQLFENYPHLIKSLGAWGGDFIMVRAHAEADLDYFVSKGYRVIIPFDELVHS